MSPPTQLSSDILLYSPSPSGKRTLIIKKPSNNTSSSSRTGTVSSGSVIIEVWNGISLEKELVVPDSLHGTVLNDGWWATGASWNYDESSVTYVAEVPVAVRTPEWGNNSDSGDNITNTVSKNKAKVQTWRGVGPWQPDWGELNSGRRRSTIFVLDCTTWDVVPALDNDPDITNKEEGEASYGQPVWTPDGKGIVFVSWPHQHENFPGFPQPLGIVYCFNRPCGLRLVEWKEGGGGGGGKGGAVVLTPHMKSAFSPRFSPDGHTLVFLSQQTAVDTGVHSATSSLHSVSWPHSSSSLSTTAVIDVVYNPATTMDDIASSTGEQSPTSSSPSFPGLYCTMLPDRPFVNDTTLVLTTQWRSTTAILGVDVVNKRYHRVSPTNNDDECSVDVSWSVLAVERGWVIAAKSTPNHPWSLWTAHVFPPSPSTSSSSSSRSNNDSNMGFNCWSVLGGLSYTSYLSSSSPSCVVVQEALSKLKTKVLHLQDPTDSDKDKQQLPFEAILIYSSNDTTNTAANKNKPSSMPAILTPHGGPHTAFSTSYIMSISYLASLGYAVIAVNYRGSTGFGEAGIQSLPGRIGTADVADCMTALDSAITYFNTANDSSTYTANIDKERVHVIGGSHGGFLTAHLVGQHPGNFKTGILRNPVCDLTAMIHMTDIPDWCFVEAGVPMDRAKTKPGPNDLAQLAKVSPSQYVEEVKAPLLFLLGAKDRRVPMDDGKRYAEALKNAHLNDKKKKGNSCSSDVVGDGLRVVVFPEDTHALDSPRTEFEQWITAVWWMKKHS